jgi:CubicO group peptidase (beta-lactamase class C family)
VNEGEGTVSGHVGAGFEAVSAAFRQNFAEGAAQPELGAAFAVFRGDEALVNLAGGFRNEDRREPWTADTLVNVYSTGKGVTALVIAMLVERGLLDYEAYVCHYWPAFTGDGKERLTLGQLLSHQSGLAGFLDPVTIEQLYDTRSMATLLAKQTPFHVPGADTCYHPLTFGVLVDTVVESATGRTLREWIGRLLQNDLDLDIFLGCPIAERSRTADLTAPPVTDFAALAALPEDARAALTNPVIEARYAATDAWRDASLAAANVHATAQALAQCFSMLACGGEIQGRRLLGHSTVEALCRERSDRPDRLLQMTMPWGAGLVRNTQGLYGPCHAVWGHSGWGGSFACADRQHGISFAYTCNRMGADLLGDPRSQGLCQALYRCLEKGR